MKNKRDLIKESEKALPLTLSNEQGDAVLTYPGELIDSLRTMNTRICKEGQYPSKLSLVSSLRGEGVSYLSMALGATIANDMRLNVCVVELNWLWPAHHPLVTENTPGLAAVLEKDLPVEDAIIKTGLPNLSFVPAGYLPRETRPVFARSSKLLSVLETIGQKFDTLILDIPAILATSDSIPLASLGDTTCMVIQQGVTSKLDVRLALDEISHLKILGVVLNRAKIETPNVLVKLIAAI